jgi:hypothetical protein
VRKLTLAEVAVVKQAILQKRQNFQCAVCPQKLTVQTGCLDHDHSTGAVRGVLCRNCNGLEGKFKSLSIRGRRTLHPTEYVRNIAAYWELHETDRTGLIYPTHLTADQKRIKRNTKARKTRAKVKKAK